MAKQIKLDWGKVLHLNNIKSKKSQVEKRIDGIESKHALEFSAEIGTKKDFKAQIKMLIDASCQYYKAQRQ